MTRRTAFHTALAPFIIVKVLFVTNGGSDWGSAEMKKIAYRAHVRASRADNSLDRHPQK
jgi:hypothetical protein